MAFFLFADALGLGKSGMQAAQIFGLELGAAIILAGLGLRIFLQKGDFSILAVTEKLYQLPSIFWVALGLLPPFIPFLVSKIFFDPNLRIKYPEGYIPKLAPIGNDIILTMDAIQMWLQNNQTNQFVFTPVANLIFTPLLLLGYPKYYYVITVATLASYLVISLLAILMSAEKRHAVIIFIAAISIFSYGLQFELERGQSHTIALMLVLLSIYIFHRHKEFRWFAYILFSISIQLKFYPALFVILFVDNWLDWKTNLKRFASLGMANFLLLFLLGFSYFQAFYNHMVFSVGDAEISVGNHSVRSFTTYLSYSGAGLFEGGAILWIREHIDLISAMLYLYFLICFLIILVNAYRKNEPGIQFDLLLACVIGSLVLPTVNHDYTLPLLTVPFALSISNWHTRHYPWPKFLTLIFTMAASFVYSISLFPINYKPDALKNSLPIIFIILTIVTGLNIAQRKEPMKNGGLPESLNTEQIS